MIRRQDLASVALSGAVVFMPLAAHTQDQSAVFVHGLTSDGSAWTTIRPYIEAELQVTGNAPTLGWPQSYVVQAANLHSTLQGLSNVIAVAHSNGGVVTRRYLTSNSAPRVNRHVSINSPHHGATLAKSALNGELAGFAYDLYSAITDPFVVYYYLDLDFGYRYFTIANTVDFLAGALGTIHGDAGLWGYASAFLAQQIFGFVPTVLSEMEPGNILLGGQLTTGALQDEAMRTSHRFSISNELDLLLQPYSIFWENSGAMQALVVSLIGFALAEYDYYSFHPDYELRMNAWLWQRLAERLYTMPIRWTQLNGAYLSPSNAYKNDGVVPWSSSRYPGGTWFDMHRDLYGEAAHTRQTSSLVIAGVVKQILNVNMGVPIRGAPPPTFTASISGAAVVPPGSQCNYSAAVSAGTPPYTFKWYVDQYLVGESSLLARSFTASQSELTLVVTDATTATASASMWVSTDPYSSGCF